MISPRYKREMEQIIAMQADLDKKLDRQVFQKVIIQPVTITSILDS